MRFGNGQQMQLVKGSQLLRQIEDFQFITPIRRIRHPVGDK
jgi:hypothetical protein